MIPQLLAMRAQLLEFIPQEVEMIPQSPEMIKQYCDGISVIDNAYNAMIIYYICI